MVMARCVHILSVSSMKAMAILSQAVEIGLNAINERSKGQK